LMFSRNRIVVFLKPKADILAKAQELKSMKDIDSLRFKYNQ